MCTYINLLFANVKGICENITKGTYTGQLETAFHAVKSGWRMRGCRPSIRRIAECKRALEQLLNTGCTETYQLRRKAAVSKDQGR